ncbi:MAG: 1-acyl-sn-glycerol-3-phosphate acyltransferase [Salinivirgaceae bacterium]|nr:1-acyl-sn-glycerol-3-phosphate acyltransferase [Salinivirgaceae bacterium]
MNQEQNKTMHQFDIKKILEDKSPKLTKFIPGFLIRYLKKIAHEEEVNDIISNYGHLRGFDFSEAMLKLFNVTITVEGEENLPEKGKYIFVSNHPLGGFDGHFIMYIIGKKYGHYKFLVNDILMNLKNMSDVFIPVNKHGKQGLELAKQIDKAYESDSQMLTFPAGLVSRKIKGSIMDLKWQKNFVVKSKQHQRDVIPIHITGGCSEFFYKLGAIRKKLGIKANIEMLYLIDETFMHKDKTFVVKFGKPIPWQTFDSSKRPLDWAFWVKQQLYKMVGLTNIKF